MADGDAATAAGYTVALPATVVPANTLANLIAKVQDDVANKVGDKGAVIPLAKGGTGGANQAAAQTALGLVPTQTVAGASGKLAQYNASGQLATATPTSSGHAANKGYVDGAVAGAAAFNGGTVTGQIYLPNSTAATSGYTIAYINGDGRISRGASSKRYKKNIKKAPAQGDLFAVPLSEFEMREGDGTRILGYIAEQLDENADLARFVVRVDDVVESIDFIQLLLAQNAQLHERLKAAGI